MEYILCSAIWYRDLPTPYHRPNNIKCGLVVCGLGHVHCLHQVVALTGKPQHQLGYYVDGFLTNENRFVDRHEAAKIALAAKQIKELQYSDHWLYSEDLFSNQQ